MPIKHHTKDKGDIAVAVTIADLTRKGYAVLSPTVSEHLPFDLVAYKDGTFARIQVKYAADGFVKCNTSWSDKSGTHRKHYDSNDFDYYAVYLPNIDKVVYPGIAFGGKTIASELPNSATPFFWYEDFLDLTNKAEKRSHKDFGYDLVHTLSPANKLANLTRKKPMPPQEELEKLILSKPMTKIGLEFGVSDSTVAKWFKFYGIATPSRGHWKTTEPRERKQSELVQQAAFTRRKVVRPSREELEKLLLEKPLQKIALDFGVSDKAIAKWAKAYGLTLPGRGYWSKTRAKALPPSNP